MTQIHGRKGSWANPDLWSMTQAWVVHANPLHEVWHVPPSSHTKHGQCPLTLANMTSPKQTNFLTYKSDLVPRVVKMGLAHCLI